MHSPSLPDVKQVSHHSEQHLCGVDGAVVIGRHLVADQVLALLGSQLLAFTEGIDVDKVVDVLSPVGGQQQETNNNSLVNVCSCTYKKQQQIKQLSINEDEVGGSSC